MKSYPAKPKLNTPSEIQKLLPLNYFTIAV